MNNIAPACHFCGGAPTGSAALPYGVWECSKCEGVYTSHPITRVESLAVVSWSRLRVVYTDVRDERLFRLEILPVENGWATVVSGTYHRVTREVVSYADID